MQRIVFFGTPHFVIPVLQVLEEHFQVVGVVTAPDAKVGRKQVITPSPIKVAYESYLCDFEKHAKETYETAILTPQQFDTETIQQVTDLKPDLLVTAAYGKIIPKAVLDIPKIGALNIHPSLLPKYRGASPIQSAILNGDTTTGVTIIQMDEKLDHGPIVAQETAEISHTDTFATLSQKLFAQAAQMLPKTIEQYSNKSCTPQAQNDQEATFCKELTKTSGYIDLTNPPSKEQIDRMIRAYYPWPTVWSKIRIKNNEVRIKFLPNTMVQLEGKNPVALETFIHGYPETKELLQNLLS